MNSGVVVDDSCYELMFVKEKTVKVMTGTGEVHLLKPCYTLNNLKGPFKFQFSKTFSNFCIKLQPWMNATYIPTVKSQVLDLQDLYGNCSLALNEAFFSASTMDERVVLAEQFLLSLDIQPNKNVAIVKEVCELIYKKQGDISVSEIAAHFGIYRQKLNQIFKQEVKYTLKTFINNVRIRACLSYKFKNPKISLTKIAYKFGYYDQAHFVHSFKNATGTSPSEYVKSPGYSFWAERFGSSNAAS